MRYTIVFFDSLSGSIRVKTESGYWKYANLLRNGYTEPKWLSLEDAQFELDDAISSELQIMSEDELEVFKILTV